MSIPAEGVRRGHRMEAIVLAVAFVLVNLATAATQKAFPFHDREGWEGASYLEMARQVAAGRFPVVDDAPMVFRLGGPALAGLVHRWTGDDLDLCFEFVNGIANALTVVLLVFWLRRFLVDWRVRTALGLLFLLQWDTPVRWMYFFPPHTDPWMWVFLLAGLIAVERCREHPTAGRIAWVAGVTVVGVCFREIVLVIALILPFTTNPIRAGELRVRWRGLLPRLVPLAAGLLTTAALRLVARRDNDYSFLWTILFFLYAKPWLVYVLSWFLAFGPILWLAILRPRKGAAFLAERQHFLVYLAGFAVLADIGGTDTERFMYWMMPVVYLLIGRSIEDRGDPWPGWLLLIFAGAQLVADRAIFWPAIPTYPNPVPHVWPIFTPFGRNVPFPDLYTDTAPRYLNLISVAEHLGFGAAVGGWLLWRSARTGRFVNRDGDPSAEGIGQRPQTG